MNKVSAAIVRVLNKHGATTGTGFVVSDEGLVVTCAHVVEYAGAGPGETMRLIFLESGVERQARVEPAFWRDASTQDIAILRLEGPSLEPLHPVALGKAAGTNDHQVGTFGFPDVKPVDGMPGKGEVIGTTTENGSQVLMIRSPEITPGFSGAPLLDLLTGRVIGMVSSIAPPDQYLRQGTTAFATPTETLRQVCTVLELSETCPYRGLHAFTEDDAAVFFGRKAFVKKLTEKLKQEPSFLAVLGPSGSGKSSLVQAGLVPLLRQGKLQGSDHWGVVIIRPTHDPFEQLSRQGLASPSHDLRMAVQQWFQQNPQQESLVLIIDQFEELFTSCLPSLSQLFVDQLTQLLDSPEAVTIILTMRDEFYSQFAQQAAKLVRWLERGTANVPSTLTQDELIEIVQAPAVSVGLNFETGLIETIVKDATDVVLNAEGERGGRSTILPLLEFALTQLWQERRDGFLTHEAFTEKVGGVTGGLTNWATRELKKIEASQRPLALRILTDLVYLGDEHQGIPDTRRRRQLTSLWRNEEEREAVQQIVQHLVEARLLVTSGNTVEIIHDALLREWKQLRDRLRDDLLFLAWRQGIEGRITRWVETAPDDINSRDKGKLLRGGDLSEAEGLLTERLYDLNAAERAFVEESIALRNREEAEQEAQRQRELQRAQELEQALARANKELAVSESQRLAFASRSVSTSAPETALLLACEAVRWDHNPLSEDVLRDALDNTPWQVTAFTGHENWITSAIFSHDGQYILTASADGTARLWDLRGTCLVRYQGHEKGVTSAIFSPDEKRILTTSRDGTARLWHPDGRSIMTLTYTSRDESHRSWRTKGTFSPDGRYMLICDRDEAWLWDADGNLQSTTWDTRPLMDTYYNSLAQGWHLYLDERARNEGHVGRIYTAVFSPDGQRILTASSDETARVWDLAGQQLAILQGHTDQVINAVFSPDGQLILTGSLDKTARLWTSSGELLATLEGHMADVGHLAFSPDSQLMLTGVDGGPADDAVPRLWDRSGKLAATLIGHSVDARIMDIAFSPDGQRILTASKDKTARLWDLEGRPLAVLRGHLSDVWKATFSPNGQSILTASGDPEPRLWEPGGSPLALIEGHKGAITGAIYNEAGTHILTSSRDGTTRLWNIAGRCIAAYDGTAEPLTENVLSPDGRYLLTHENVVQGYVSVSGLVRQWQLPRTIRWFGQQASRDGTQRVARRTTHRRKRFSAGHGVSDAPLITFTVREETRSGSSGSVESAVFSPDGTRILIHASSNTQIRDRQGQLLAVLNGPNLNKRESLSVDYVMFSPDSQRVVTGSINGSVWLWTRDGQLITSFLTDDKSARDNLFSVTFSPDGQRILTTIRRSADLWDLNGHHLTSLPCSTNKVKRALFSPDGDRILTVAEAYFPNVSLWDRNGNFISQLHATYGEWAPICFDQQGKLLCIVDSNIAKIWDRDGSVVAVLVIDRETWITQTTFSSDGEQLLLGTASGIAQLWSLRDGGKLLSTFKGHTSEVKSVVFSPDGRRVLTASSDGTARQFLVHADDLLAAASRRAGRSLDAQEIARFNIPTPLRFNPKV